MTPQMPASSPVAVPCDEGVLLLIDPPPGWVMAAPTPPSRLTLLDPTAAGPSWPSLNVLVQDLGKLSTDEFLTLSRLQMKAAGDSVTVERDEPVGREPGGAHRFEFLAAAAPRPVRCRQLILFHGRRAFIVMALAPSQQFEAYRAAFERALDSVMLRVTG